MRNGWAVKETWIGRIEDVINLQNTGVLIMMTELMLRNIRETVAKKDERIISGTVQAGY